MSKSYIFAINLIKKYKWQSVFVQYWAKIVPLFLVPFLIINCTIYFLFNNVISKEFKSSLMNSCEKTGTIIDNMFSKIDVQYSSIAYNDYLLSYITTPIERNDNVPSNLRILSTLTNNFIKTSKYMVSIYVYSFLNDYVYSTNGGNYLKNFRDTAWYENYEKTANPNFLIPVNNDSGNYIDKIAVSYGIYSGEKIIGMIVFNVSADYISDIVGSDLNYNLKSMFIADTNGNVVYSSNEEYSKINDTHPLWDIYNQNQTSELIYTKKGDGVFLSKNIISDRLTLIFDADSDYFSKRTYTIKVVFVICFALAVIIPILMALYISFKFYNSLYCIITSLSNSQANDDTDEISYIISNISNLTKLNKNFENDMIMRVQQLKRAQSMALRLQFNPHFLFNTLNMINLTIARYAKGDNDASRAIVLLSDLLYASMNTNDYVITLSEELDYEKKYIQLLGIQHDNSFDVELDIDDNTLNSKVLKLMLQPIIENAFQHGMKLMEPEELFKIKISSEIEGKNLIIKVFNNGEPIDKEHLEKIIESLENDDIIQHKHIGLNNIHQRIRLLYGDAYGCKISSDNSGTTVIIILPLQP